MENEETKPSDENVSESSSLPSLAQLHDKIKAENDRTEALLKRQEELAARNLLGGRTDAGIQPEKPKEDSPHDFMKKVMSGEKKPDW